MDSNFTKPNTKAGSHDVQVRRRAVCGKLGSAVGEKNEDDPGPEDLNAVGLSFATMKQFDEFFGTLSQSGQLLATILWKTHGCGFDEEFRTIASAEISNSKVTFS